MTMENEEGNIYLPKEPASQQPEKKSYINDVKETFLNIPKKIEQELDNSKKNQNNWLNCFITHASIINGLLYMAKKREELGSEKYDSANIKMEELKKKLQELTLDKQYQGKDAIIPEEIKQELLDFLTWSNILGE